MCEITRQNFEEKFPEIEDSIRRAEFVGIDTEFTGLSTTKGQDARSLFDTGEERYCKQVPACSQFTICQIGISSFVKDPSCNRYHAYTYNIPLFPVSFGSVDSRFLVQASSLEFLCEYNFDFNKYIYEGVPFLNTSQEKRVKKIIDGSSKFDGQERDIDEEGLQNMCSEIADWVVKAKEGECLTVRKPKRVSDFMVHNEILQRFKMVWPDIQLNNKINIKKVSTELRDNLEKETENSDDSHRTRAMNSALGFTRVFQLLAKYKKPLIGHNVATDLMLIYDKFYKFLPDRYPLYKDTIHELFPCIFDTKHIVLNLRRPYKDTGLFEDTSLGALYTMLSGDKGRFHVLHSPDITHAEGFNKYVGCHTPHEAGFDAYMVGYVFLRVSHICAMEGIKSTESRPVDFRQYLTTMKAYKNRVNMIRAAVDYIQMDGLDPPSRRPNWLYVESKQKTYRLNAGQLARWFSEYGSVDIKMQNSNRTALIAVGNYGCAKDILRNFRCHDLIYVSKYSMWRHSPIVRGVLWTGVLVSGGLCMWALLSNHGGKTK